MWLLSVESLASLVWALGLVVSLVLVLVDVVRDDAPGLFGLGLAWGIAIAVVATVQLAIALAIEYSYDPRGLRAFLLATDLSDRVLDGRRGSRCAFASSRSRNRDEGIARPLGYPARATRTAAGRDGDDDDG